MAAAAPHTPVLLAPLLAGVAPVSGTWIDGTLGAGGYTRGLLEAGADRVIGIDRDPHAHRLAAEWGATYGNRLEVAQTTFSQMDDVASQVDGVVLDLGVSSMQLDQAERGFSFMKDGPLDMRMSQSGPSAADLVNDASEEELTAILQVYGEERAARRIARAIVQDRPGAAFTTTLQLAGLIERLLPRAKPGQSHPATRSFQALRIAVNDEFGELAKGLMAAERVLKPGGWLAVVTFHSLEDRVVKRFLALRSDEGGGGNRYAPERDVKTPGFILRPRRAIAPSEDELAANPRARSARLRLAQRTEAPAQEVSYDALGLPQITDRRRRR